ncbi:MAG: hypothetical protein DBX59_10005 [Bacillota bacterium]|nr:MAG: hypothetical protein DBX59_10005 [Bacillota bacterium]
MVKNKVGSFSADGKVFKIEDMFPKRVLMNYLWSESVVCKCDQFGCCESFAGVGAYRRSLDRGERLVYIKDKESGKVFAANRNFERAPFDEFYTEVGLGTHRVISEYEGIRTEFGICVPKEGFAELFAVKIKNTKNVARSLSFCFFLRPCADLSGHASYGFGNYDGEIGGLYYPHEGFAIDTEYKHLYFAASEKADSFDVNNDTFIGYDSLAYPAGMKADKLISQGSTFQDFYCGALRYELQLSAGEEKTYYFAVGTEKTRRDCIASARKFASSAFFENSVKEQAEINGRTTDVFQAHTPDEYLDIQTNVWLKRQLSLGKTWGRVYGKGFRDVMQDITAFVSFDPALAKTRILYALKHQYISGNPIRMYEPDFTYPYMDGAAWIPATMLSYLKETADFAVLDKKIPYLDDAAEETVFRHIERGLEFLLSSRGERNLILWGGGDWNDSMNNAGMLGKGESVWLSIATYKAVGEWIEILGGARREERVAEWNEKRGDLRAAILKHGYENSYFIYGFNDYGEKAGSADCEEGKIYLNPQTWAVLADILPKEELSAIMDKVEEKLSCDFGYTQCAPSYTHGTDRFGRSTYFQAGLVENGSVYIHGVAFKIVADCLLGRAEHAYDTLKRLSVYNPKNPDSGMEPYAVSNMYIGPENRYRAGDAPMSWITGSAGWLYRAVSEYLLGVRADFNGLRIVPCLPKDWSGVTVSRKFRNAQYAIEYVKSNENALVVDGERIEGDLIEYREGKHNVVCYYKS